jgi:hypothetical protein
VSVDYDTLSSRVGEAGLVDFDTRLSASAVRRLACDAEILPLVLGSRSQVLDVGRSSRLVTPGLWHALVARDRHCAFPGCTRMPIACDAHHVRHWADGGATALDNLVLLCRTHHTVVPPPRGRSASTPTTTDPCSRHHPAGTGSPGTSRWEDEDPCVSEGPGRGTPTAAAP